MTEGTEQPVPAAPPATPRCYKHPNVETWVSCGRCGRPLCPDCVRHGPVGVRCEACLYPEGRVRGAGMPHHVAQANAGSLVLALAWTGLLVAIAVLQGRSDFTFAAVPAPNLLVAGLAGGTVGYLHYRLCGRAWSGATRAWVVLLGLAMPLIAALVLAVHHHGAPATNILFLIRTAAAVAISTFFAWLLVTMPD